MIKTKMQTKINYKKKEISHKTMNVQSKNIEKKTKLIYERSLQNIEMIKK